MAFLDLIACSDLYEVLHDSVEPEKFRFQWFVQGHGGRVRIGIQNKPEAWLVLTYYTLPGPAQTFLLQNAIHDLCYGLNVSLKSSRIGNLISNSYVNSIWR